MEIKFTAAQYRRLLDIVYAGIMVINGNQQPRHRIQEYEEVEQYIYAQAKDFGFGHLIAFNASQQRHYTTKDFDRTEIGNLMDHYHETIFWHSLAFQLAKRDVLKQLENKEIQGQDVGGRILEEERAYRQEFLENGLEKLSIHQNKAECKEERYD